MSHGRLFRIASEWQKKKKTIWRVWSGMRKTWKMRAAALLLTAVCTVGASFAAYADDVPSGPASDMELIQRREQASGSQNEAGDAQTGLLPARIMLAQRKDSRQQRTRRQEITDRLLLRHRERGRGTARFRMEW